MGFTFMVDHFFEDKTLALPSTYYATGAPSGVPVQLIFRQPDELFSLGGLAVQAPTYTVDIRVGQVTNPQIGDRLLIKDTLYEINTHPKADPLHLIWSLGVRPL